MRRRQHHSAPAVRGQRSEARSQKSEVRGQRSEVRSQKSEVRSQRSDCRGQKSDCHLVSITWHRPLTPHHSPVTTHPSPKDGPAGPVEGARFSTGERRNPACAAGVSFTGEPRPFRWRPLPGGAYSYRRLQARPADRLINRPAAGGLKLAPSIIPWLVAQKDERAGPPRATQGAGSVPGAVRPSALMAIWRTPSVHRSTGPVPVDGRLSR
jgi:hypothetical protein